MALTDFQAVIDASKRLDYLIEDPIGSNDGTTLRAELQGNTLWQPGQPWCLYFAQRAIELACPNIRRTAPWLFATGSCSRLAQLAQDHQCLWNSPVEGGIVLLTNDGGLSFYHAGIDLGASLDSQITRLYRSGNTNNIGSPEGYKVCVHEIHTGFCRWVSWPNH